MGHYIGIDVSTKERGFRILDSAAKMVRDTRLPTDL
jgi:hypothetical protein